MHGCDGCLDVILTLCNLKGEGKLMKVQNVWKTCPCSICVVIVDGLGGEVVEDIVVKVEEMLYGEWSGDVFLEVGSVVLNTAGADEGSHGTFNCSLPRWAK